MMNDVSEDIAAFVVMPKNKANSGAKELNTTNINTNGAVPKRLPLNSLFLQL